MSFYDGYDKAVQEIYHYFEMSRYEQVLDKTRKLLSQEPNDPDILFIMAESLFQLDQYQEAIDACLEALEYGLSHEDGHYLLGRVHMAMDNYQKAEESFLEVLRENPMNASTLAAYGYLMLATGHDQKAAKLMEEALRIDPEDEIVLNYNFYFNVARGNTNYQLETLQQFLVNSDNEVRKLVNLGLFELYRNNYRAAREHIKEAYLLDPTNERLLDLLQEIEKDSHFLFWPQRLGERIGNPAAIWIGAIGTIAVLRYLGYGGIAGIVAAVYLIWALSTWITPVLYKIFVRRK